MAEASKKKTSSTKSTTTKKKKTNGKKATSKTTVKKTTTKPKTAATSTVKTQKETITYKENLETKPIVVKKTVEVKKDTKVKTKEEESWLYVFLLTAVVLLVVSLKPFVINYHGSDISFAIFGLPFVYFISNYITKKFDYVESLKAIFASLVVMIFYLVISSMILGKEVLITDIGGDALGYLGSQLINLTIYYYLLVYAEGHGLLVFMNFVFSILVYNFIFILFSFGTVTMNTFWLSFMVSLMIQVIIFIPLSFIDSQIKRGL